MSVLPAFAAGIIGLPAHMNLVATGWNVALFEYLHASDASPRWLIASAAVLAEAPLYAALALAAWTLLRTRDRRGALQLASGTFLALVIEAAISRWAFHPRPFAAGMGHAWMMHAANNSMPSTHVTLAWVAALVLFTRRRPATGTILVILGAVLAWARIYVGIHWPADMLGAALSAVVCASIGWTLGHVVAATAGSD